MYGAEIGGSKMKFASWVTERKGLVLMGLKQEREQFADSLAERKGLVLKGLKQEREQRKC